MKTVAHVYPWDVVGDPAAAQRYAELGVDAVALAASYHTVRAATPLHPEHRLIDARHAAFYLPVREEAWQGKRLRPAEPSWVAADSYRAARDALKAAGLPVYAWTVLTHSSRLGDLHPDVTVVNAFGDRYPYALCPSNQDVVEYCRTLVEEIIKVGQPDGIILEACGALGFVHGGHHEKTEGADWDPARQKLLSICFCAGCTARYEDADGLRAQIRAEDQNVELPGWVADARTSVAADLRKLLVTRIRELAPDIRVIVHANSDPWATGPFATVAPQVGVEVDALVAMAWPGPDASAPNIRALRKIAPDTRIAGYVLALPPKPADGAAMLAEMRALAEEGVEEFHLYHAGLASAARLDAIRDAVSALRAT
ncbi:hypothetical protein JOF56_011319 [Kibdelosporangium banguiense]|uniref:Alanine-rich protein n=1 Tax=Kibdelosporangium banguiense TaxID=1365924 RepID=A0ABS4U2N9_9PSEU|nr:hypothetical protein [Kibdelosporangium banguiense]MBP2330934.1 hypothetical protein [Kibdelosporangium banguiense]